MHPYVLYALAAAAVVAFLVTLALGSNALVVLKSILLYLNPPHDETKGPRLRRRLIPEKGWLALKVMRDLANIVPKPGDGPIALGTKTLAAVSFAEELLQKDPWKTVDRWLNQQGEFKSGYLNGARLAVQIVEAIADEFDAQVFYEKFERVVRQHTHRQSGKRVWIWWEGKELGGIWLESGFSVADLQGEVWSSFGNAIDARFPNGNRIEISRIPPSNDPLYGESGETLRSWKGRFQRCRADKVPRSYLLAGPPGTGKSTAALQACRDLGLRVLRLNGMFGTYEWAFELLRPDVLLLEDYDRRIPENTDLSAVLTWLTDIRSEGVTVILTANDVTALPEALVRPGRIDEVLEFPAPTEETRYAVLKGYIDLWELSTGVDREGGLRLLVAGTEGDTEATLRYVAEQLRYDTPDKILAILNARRRILKRNVVTPSAAKPSETPNGEPETVTNKLRLV
jgi:ATPase family associated with various cellular activities (AAA)